MWNLRCTILWSLCTMFSLCCDMCPAQSPPRVPLTAEQQKQIKKELQTLQHALDEVPRKTQEPGYADAAIYAKAVTWALKYDREFSPAKVELMERALAKGRERIPEIAKRVLVPTPWLQEETAFSAGKHALGYISKVDGSVQPYGVVVPETPITPVRLDVVLHGSSQPVGMSELKFMSRFDAELGKPSAVTKEPYIELHPFGRVENCYRWAGESDVFEAIEDVCRRFNIDRRKIVLRGMSMGASGTWHLGLKHPDRFAALGPYCGYVDTHRFSETPLPNFVKVGVLPEHQELGLHMLDSVDYAANAGMVPAIACIGEKDIFFDAHVIMGEAMRREGLQMVNLISPGTGHVIDPITHAEQMRLIKAFADRGINNSVPDVRFVTWTLKYSFCHWIQLLGLDQHYQRAEIVAHIRGDTVHIPTIKNINRFAILTGSTRGGNLPEVPKRIQIGDEMISLPLMRKERSIGVIIRRTEDKWEYMDDLLFDEMSPTAERRKQPGSQGPIDDAFTQPFLCVRGTGEPWNAAAEAYAEASLQRFADEWHHYFRGELPIKPDTEVTEEDLKTKNLILFGDPGSNSWIAKVQSELPLEWSKETLQIGDLKVAASKHVPALIFPNPLPGAERNYIVLNTGHTFHASELGKVNYLLFPRWGDWAVLKFDAAQAEKKVAVEEVVRAGYFNEQWQVKK